MKLQGFKFKIQHIKGVENIVADYISRAKVEINVCEEDESDIIIKGHEAIGHGGKEATELFLRGKYNIMHLRKKIKEILDNFEICKKFANPEKNLQKIRLDLSGPFKRVGIDLVGPISNGEGKQKYIITAIDYLTRWAITDTMKRKSAMNVANFIFEKIVCIHGPSAQILSDQGTEFTNELLHKLCKRINATKSRTSAYNPKCNGSVERLNKTLIEKLAKICNEDLSNWSENVPLATYAYNISPNGRLGKSPFEMLYGRPPREFTKEFDENSYEKEEEVLSKINLLRKEAHENAINQRNKEISKMKKGRPVNDLSTRDIVYRRALPTERRYKLSPKFLGPYKVVRKNEMGSYTIAGFENKEKVLNRKDLIKAKEVDKVEVKFKEGEVQPELERLELA